MASTCSSLRPFHCCVLPLVHILAVSFSGKAAASANLVTLWPIDFTVDAYTKTFGNSNFLSALWISVQRTVLGTLLSMVLVILTAYPLSKESLHFKGRSMYAWFSSSRCCSAAG